MEIQTGECHKVPRNENKRRKKIVFGKRQDGGLEMRPPNDTFGGRVDRGGGPPGRVERGGGPPGRVDRGGAPPGRLDRGGGPPGPSGPPGPPPGAMVEERKDRIRMEDHNEWEKVLDTISQERWRHKYPQHIPSNHHRR